MNAFLIFVVVLTVGYLIYYGVTISRDLIAARKSETSTVETFDMSSLIDDLKTIDVVETEEGFSISGQNDTTDETDDVYRPVEPKVEDAVVYENLPAEKTKAESDADEVNSIMDKVEAQTDNELAVDEMELFLEAMANGTASDRVLNREMMPETSEKPDNGDETKEDNQPIDNI